MPHYVEPLAQLLCPCGAVEAAGGCSEGPGAQAHSRLYRVMICRQFSSCRLYSWILFTCTSNMEEGLIFTLYSFSRKAENFSLFSWGGKRTRRVKPLSPQGLTEASAFQPHSRAGAPGDLLGIGVGQRGTEAGHTPRWQK